VHLACRFFGLGNVLIVSIQQALHDRLALTLQDDITTALSRTGADGLLIDVSVIDIVDSFMGRMLNDIAAMALLMGARTALVGIQPAVAITLTELGLELRGIVTALDVEQGLARLPEANHQDQNKDLSVRDILHG
jgi:rsbT antagonist protein RsbS